ncbi:50S ribosomal protein L5 [Candidatus Woesearchaeota archaeon]|jgi:large subunit ribosomal protein L5|nr:50S ribosomal protein L5 [Candidatus Woesearchaeota archaeon]
MNVMKKIKIEKVTLNIGAGKDQKVLDKAIKLLENITGIKPIKTTTNKRIQSWGLRPGLPIGCKITLRGEEAKKMVERIIYAKDNNLQESYFDEEGNISFGIKEYVDIKDAKYDPSIGMMGLQATITLSRPGFRVKTRRIRPSTLPPNHRITKEEAIQFMKDNYSVKTGDEL